MCLAWHLLVIMPWPLDHHHGLNRMEDLQQQQKGRQQQQFVQDSEILQLSSSQKLLSHSADSYDVHYVPLSQRPSIEYAIDVEEAVCESPIYDYGDVDDDAGNEQHREILSACSTASNRNRLSQGVAPSLTPIQLIDSHDNLDATLSCDGADERDETTPRLKRFRFETQSHVQHQESFEKVAASQRTHDSETRHRPQHSAFTFRRQLNTAVRQDIQSRWCHQFSDQGKHLINFKLNNSYQRTLFNKLGHTELANIDTCCKLDALYQSPPSVDSTTCVLLFQSFFQLSNMPSMLSFLFSKLEFTLQLLQQSVRETLSEYNSSFLSTFWLDCIHTLHTVDIFAKHVLVHSCLLDQNHFAAVLGKLMNSLVWLALDIRSIPSPDNLIDNHANASRLSTLTYVFHSYCLAWLCDGIIQINTQEHVAQLSTAPLCADGTTNMLARESHLNPVEYIEHLLFFIFQSLLLDPSLLLGRDDTDSSCGILMLLHQLIITCSHPTAKENLDTLNSADDNDWTALSNLAYDPSVAFHKSECHDQTLLRAPISSSQISLSHMLRSSVSQFLIFNFERPISEGDNSVKLRRCEAFCMVDENDFLSFERLLLPTDTPDVPRILRCQAVWICLIYMFQIIMSRDGLGKLAVTKNEQEQLIANLLDELIRFELGAYTRLDSPQRALGVSTLLQNLCIAQNIVGDGFCFKLLFNILELADVLHSMMAPTLLWEYRIVVSQSVFILPVDKQLPMQTPFESLLIAINQSIETSLFHQSKSSDLDELPSTVYSSLLMLIMSAMTNSCLTSTAQDFVSANDAEIYANRVSSATMQIFLVFARHMPCALWDQQLLPKISRLLQSSAISLAAMSMTAQLYIGLLLIVQQRRGNLPPGLNERLRTHLAIICLLYRQCVTRDERLVPQTKQLPQHTSNTISVASDSKSSIDNHAKQYVDSVVAKNTSTVDAEAVIVETLSYLHAVFLLVRNQWCSQQYLIAFSRPLLHLLDVRTPISAKIRHCVMAVMDAVVPTAEMSIYSAEKSVKRLENVDVHCMVGGAAAQQPSNKSIPSPQLDELVLAQQHLAEVHHFHSLYTANLFSTVYADAELALERIIQSVALPDYHQSRPFIKNAVKRSHDFSITPKLVRDAVYLLTSLAPLACEHGRNSFTKLITRFGTGKKLWEKAWEQNDPAIRRGILQLPVQFAASLLRPGICWGREHIVDKHAIDLINWWHLSMIDSVYTFQHLLMQHFMVIPEISEILPQTLALWRSKETEYKSPKKLEILRKDLVCSALVDLDQFHERLQRQSVSSHKLLDLFVPTLHKHWQEASVMISTLTSNHESIPVIEKRIADYFAIAKQLITYPGSLQPSQSLSDFYLLITVGTEQIHAAITLSNLRAFSSSTQRDSRTTQFLACELLGSTLVSLLQLSECNPKLTMSRIAMLFEPLVVQFARTTADTALYGPIFIAIRNALAISCQSRHIFAHTYLAFNMAAPALQDAWFAIQSSWMRYSRALFAIRVLQTMLQGVNSFENLDALQWDIVSVARLVNQDDMITLPEQHKINQAITQRTLSTCCIATKQKLYVLFCKAVLPHVSCQTAGAANRCFVWSKLADMIFWKCRHDMLYVLQFNYEGEHYSSLRAQLAMETEQAFNKIVDSTNDEQNFNIDCLRMALLEGLNQSSRMQKNAPYMSVDNNVNDHNSMERNRTIGRFLDTMMAIVDGMCRHADVISMAPADVIRSFDAFFMDMNTLICEQKEEWHLASKITYDDLRNRWQRARQRIVDRFG